MRPSARAVRLRRSDGSWLGSDARGHVGWFTANGEGALPVVVPAALDVVESRFGVWVRSQGLPFRFGAGGADGLEQWRAAAALGVFAFDHHDGAYRVVCAPEHPIEVTDLPDLLARHAGDHRLSKVCFGAGTVVTRDDLERSTGG